MAGGKPAAAPSAVSCRERWPGRKGGRSGSGGRWREGRRRPDSGGGTSPPPDLAGRILGDGPMAANESKSDNDSLVAASCVYVCSCVLDVHVVFMCSCVLEVKLIDACIEPTFFCSPKTSKVSVLKPALMTKSHQCGLRGSGWENRHLRGVPNRHQLGFL